eukprot:TRINITY_DN2038_c0_g1_i1.p1 TRINITY_DN2038_c0_g1~~TRINITY_DN2038_c0_g1_i1.p1  ORF type:complete len:403 (-),score=84.67 TRINITY_DN2038_c0_g1_i1:354-1484(-)
MIESCLDWIKSVSDQTDVAPPAKRQKIESNPNPKSNPPPSHTTQSKIISLPNPIYTSPHLQMTSTAPIQDIIENELERTDSMLARELMKEEEERYEREMQQQEGKIQPAQFECPVCIETLPVDHIFIGKQCTHNDEANESLCRDCGVEYIRTQISENKFPLKCFIRGCGAEFVLEDLEMILSPEEVQRVDELLLKRAIATAGVQTDGGLKEVNEWFPCLKPGCEGGILFDPENEFTRFTCDGCSSVWCVKCMDEFHDNETCQRYQAWKKENGKSENLMDKLIREGTVKKCPSCRTPSQKAEGCNFLVCSQCQHQWCWFCGDSHASCSCGKNEHKPMGRAQPQPRDFQQQPLVGQQPWQQQQRQQGGRGRRRGRENF